MFRNKYYYLSDIILWIPTTLKNSINDKSRGVNNLNGSSWCSIPRSRCTWSTCHVVWKHRKAKIISLPSARRKTTQGCCVLRPWVWCLRSTWRKYRKRVRRERAIRSICYWLARFRRLRRLKSYCRENTRHLWRPVVLYFWSDQKI